MMALIKRSNNQIVVNQVEVAKSFSKRLVGLIGRKDLSDSCLWIPSCNSIHTCFMRFPIDLAFVDSKLKIIDVRQNVRPWRMVVSSPDANGVFELPDGTIAMKSLEIGDFLNVDENFNR